ncbi:MAG: SufS family cysteine desulfurase [Pseudomonadales bacterium]
MPEFDPLRARRDFPILSARVNGVPLVYFDNAATTQKPRSVQDALTRFYKLHNANVHRGAHQLSSQATQAFESARDKVARFINANSREEVIWTRGTTESINLVAHSLGSLVLEAGDTILVGTSEHHANIVPWQQLAQRHSAQVLPIPLNSTHGLDQDAYAELLSTRRPKIVALGQVSNALGVRQPIEAMLQAARASGAYTLVDGAQAIAHESVDVQALNCDFYCFSGHKMYGPTGIGVLWGRRELLERMPPWQCGGEMIAHVSFEQTRFNALPFKFEAGTPPIAAAIGLGAAIDYLCQFDRGALGRYEHTLTQYLFEKLGSIEGLNLLHCGEDNVGVASFTLDELHHQDVAAALDQQGIAVRSGHHCAMPLMQQLGIDGSLRASVCFYNTREEIDTLYQALSCTVRLLREPLNPSLETTAHTVIELPSASEVMTRLDKRQSWQLKFEQLTALAAYLAHPAQLNAQHLLSGCESNVWLHFEAGKAVVAWSDAKIMRGILVVLLSCQQAVIEDAQGLLEQLHLTDYLSTSRTNGARQMIEYIKASAHS